MFFEVIKGLVPSNDQNLDFEIPIGYLEDLIGDFLEDCLPFCLTLEIFFGCVIARAQDHGIGDSG